MADLVEIERQIDQRLQEVAPDLEEACDYAAEDVRHGMLDHLGDWSYDMNIIDALQDGQIWKGLGDEERRALVKKVVDRYYPEAS